MIPKTIFIPLRNFKENQPWAEKAHYYLTKFLTQHTDYKIILYCSHIDPQEAVYLMKYKNVRVIQQKKYYFFLLNYFILKFKPDIVLSWRWEDCAISLIARIFTDLKFLSFIHGFLYLEFQNKFKNKLINLVYFRLSKYVISEFISFIFTPSSVLREYLIKQLDLTSGKVILQYNWIPDVRNHPKSLKIFNNKVIFTWWFSITKWVYRVIETAKHNPEFDFYIYWNTWGPESKKMQILIESLKLRNVTVVGYSYDIQSEFPKFSILFYPSELDNLPLTVLEAFREWLLVISTPIGELQNILIDRENSFIIKDDYFDFWVINNSDLEKIRGNWRKLYEKFFTLSAYAGIQEFL